MKKVVLITLVSIFALGAITALFFILYNPPLVKISNTKISYEITGKSESENFISGYKADKTSINLYTIKFMPNAEKDFGAYEIKTSLNVTQNCVMSNNAIIVSILIKSGTSFSITLESTNYETKTFEFDAVPYIQSDDVSLEVLNLVDRNNITYELETININKRRILYLVDNNFFAEAIKDRLPSKVDVKISITNGAKNKGSLASSDTSVIKIVNNAIIPQKVGDTTLTFNALDGSNVTKTFYFRVQNVPADKLSLSNLPSQINFVKPSYVTYNLNDVSILPSYVQNGELTFESSNIAVFKIENKLITGLKVGTAQLIIKLDGAEFSRITVNITQSMETQLKAFTTANSTTEIGETFFVNIASGSEYTFYISLVGTTQYTTKIFDSFEVTSGKNLISAKTLNLFPEQMSQDFKFKVLGVGRITVVFSNADLNLSLTVNIEVS